MKNTILTKILKSKLNWISHRKKIQPLNNFINNVNQSNISLNKALQKNRPSFILEIKQASPSLGKIRKKFNIIEIVKTYNKYASAISVLTDTEYFQGDFSFIPIVRSCSNLPILCKDFIIDPYQIYLARYYQANAILLMLSILNNYQYNYLSSIATNMNMDILTEINNLKELKRAIVLKAKIIGINNRNLNNLSINMNTTEIIAPLIPKTIITISESGFSNYQSVRKVTPLVNGFLIGSFLMKNYDLDLSIRKVILGNNKICGLTRIEDSETTRDVGAIYGGLIFVPESPRCITLKTAKHIMKINRLSYIGVFKDEEIDLIVSVATKLQLYAIQLHGNEHQDYINQLRKKLPPNIHIWKAFSIINKIPKCNMQNIQYFLYDNIKGGSGHTFNWNLLNKKIPNNAILSGGLNLNNCVKASYLGFSGLDFNSGVETTIGIKNTIKIHSIFKKLRYYSTETYTKYL